MNHLYVQTAFLGDLLLAVPALKGIRRWTPEAKISLVCRKGYGSFFETLGLVDEIFEVDKKSKAKLAKDKLSTREFHTIFCPHQSVTSQKLVKACHAKNKIGYKSRFNGAGFSLSVKRNLLWPEAMRQLQLVALADSSLQVKLEAFANDPQAIPEWAEMTLSQLQWPESQVQAVLDKKLAGLKLSTPYICLAPGSVWPTKRWTESSFAKVATQLARENCNIILIGAPEEREICERIEKNSPNCFSLAGKLSIHESLKLLSKARGLICNDSGAMHMASLLKLPTISIFGPTVLELGYKPWNPKALVMENPNLLCRPCGQHGGRFCPIGTHRCMTDVGPGDVAEQALVMFR